MFVIDRVQHAARGQLANRAVLGVEQIVGPGKRGGAQLVQPLHLIGRKFERQILQTVLDLRDFASSDHRDHAAIPHPRQRDRGGAGSEPDHVAMAIRPNELPGIRSLRPALYTSLAVSK